MMFVHASYNCISFLHQLFCYILCNFRRGLPSESVISNSKRPRRCLSSQDAEPMDMSDMEEDDPTDLSYHPAQDLDVSTDSEPDQDSALGTSTSSKRPHEEDKYIIFRSSLEELFR